MENKNLFEAVKCKDELPNEPHEFNTDKGKLWFFPNENSWSCREDRISEKYPTYWLRPVPLPDSKDAVENELVVNTLEAFAEFANRTTGWDHKYVIAAFLKESNLNK